MIGSFYARFENKEAFVDALQRIVVEDHLPAGRRYGSVAGCAGAAVSLACQT
jgi:hypothetical protein